MKFDLEEKVNIMISGRHVHLTSEAIISCLGMNYMLEII